MKITGNKDTIDWYDANAEKYALGSNTVTFENTAKYLLKRLPANPKILEAGCGSGRDAATLSNLGATVIGLDISKGLLAVARRERPGITFVQGSILSIPFQNENFDGVWSHASLVHLDTIEDVKTALHEFNRVLKPNGYLYVYVKQQQGDEKTAVVSDTLSNHERFFRYYTKEELSSLLEEVGFTIDHITIDDDAHGRDEVKWIKVFAKK